MEEAKMFGSRKRSLTIVLTVIGVLAMLAPIAMAAPEWVDGVTLDGPTPAAPDYILGGEKVEVTVDFTIMISGLQVDGVWARAYLLDKNGDKVGSEGDYFAPAELDTGANAESITIKLHWPDQGWYDLKVCVGDEFTDKVCASTPPNVTGAVAIQYSGPDVDLEKPEWKAAVTGTQYLMVGTAEDDFGITRVEFQYCDISNSPRHCTKWASEGDDADVWVKIADGTKTAGVMDQWQATWDSSQVPDEWPWEFHGGYPDSLTGGEHPGALIRMCAWNHVKLSNCYEREREDFNEAIDGGNWPDAHLVFVNNRYMIELEPGWNLISTPLLLYQPAVAQALGQLIADGTVASIWSYEWNGTTFVWKTWAPGAPAPTLANVLDGQGYWLEMKAEDVLNFVGTWSSVGPMAPPMYAVHTGWNLIGYTQWGRPMWLPSKEVEDYLGPAVAPNVQAIWRWDAETTQYRQVFFNEHLIKGAGYWLATVADGPIAP
jgi:hypothetical protein